MFVAHYFCWFILPILSKDLIEEMHQTLSGYKAESNVDYLLRSITGWIMNRNARQQMKSETLEK